MDILNDDCHSLVFKWLTLKEKARYERVCWRWKKLMYRHQNEIKLYELRGRNNERLFDDNAFLVSILAKINDNIEKIDLGKVASGEPEPPNYSFTSYNCNFLSILDAIGENCPNLCE